MTLVEMRVKWSLTLTDGLSPEKKLAHFLAFVVKVKNVILKDFKILRNDPETKHIFSLPSIISFKRDKKPRQFLS